MYTRLKGIYFWWLCPTRAWPCLRPSSLSQQCEDAKYLTKQVEPRCFGGILTTLSMVIGCFTCLNPTQWLNRVVGRVQHLPRSINAQTFYKASHELALYKASRPTEEAVQSEKTLWKDGKDTTVWKSPKMYQNLLFF